MPLLVRPLAGERFSAAQAGARCGRSLLPGSVVPGLRRHATTRVPMASKRPPSNGFTAYRVSVPVGTPVTNYGQTNYGDSIRFRIQQNSKEPHLNLKNILFS